MTKLNPAALIVTCLLVVTAFIVPIVGPLRSASAHLLIAVAIVLCGAVLSYAVLGPWTPNTPDTEV